MDYIHISEIMSLNNEICVFCQQNEDTLQLKTFQEASWKTAKNAADRRKSLKRNKHSTATEEIIKAEHAEGYVYHSQCFSQFCAVKRLPSPKSEHLTGKYIMMPFKTFQSLFKMKSSISKHL